MGVGKPHSRPRSAVAVEPQAMPQGGPRRAYGVAVARPQKHSWSDDETNADNGAVRRIVCDGGGM